MAKNKRIIYQFPLSVYCEKTRWNLDAKGLDYTCQDLIPTLHAFTSFRLAHQRPLPVLRDGRQAIGDSTKIALYLEHRYPTPVMIPTDPADRTKVLAFEEWFDELGDHVRRYCWSLEIEGSKVSTIFFGFSGYASWKQSLAEVCRPLWRLLLRRTFDIEEPYSSRSLARVEDALPRLEKWLQGDVNNYLVGGQFSLADLTAACMLAPLIGPDNSPWSDARLSGVVGQKRAEVRATVAGQWVLRMYREHRQAIHQHQPEPV
jgi:glutathione S-transferase